MHQFLFSILENLLNKALKKEKEEDPFQNQQEAYIVKCMSAMFSMLFCITYR